MREIHFLLGDPLSGGPFRIEEWVLRAQPKSQPHEYTLSGSPEHLFEYACALLYDSRLHRAMEIFQFVSALSAAERKADLDILARLGYGRALNLLRRYRPADVFFATAMEKLQDHSHPLLKDIAKYHLVLNASDRGNQLSEIPWLSTPRPDQTASPATDILLEAFRVFVCTRLCLRSSQRQLGLEVVEKFLDDQRISQLAPIMKGMVLRMRGILLDISGSTDLARSNLRQVIDIFCTAGFQLGEVQAALSLARAHGPTDRKQMKEYLDRARQILEATEPPTATSTEGRHMPGERADLYSRRGNFEYAQGNLEEAIALYRQDLRLLSELAADPSEGLPRAAAYAHRNLGRALLTIREHDEAAQHFQKSLDIFRAANDPINTFSTLYSLCDTWLETKSFPAVAKGIEQLESILSPLRDRPKERAIIEILRAKLARYHFNDNTEALARISRGVGELRRFGPDYHYVQALILQAEIQESLGDDLAARQRLVEARLCASNLEMPELQKVVEARLSQLGIPEVQIQSLRKTELERQVDLVGFVRKDLTILFADLRGFTAISHDLDASIMAEFIHEFASLISRATSLHGGFPARFLGDCVMAIFGARGMASDKEHNALQAVCRVYERFTNLRTRWARQFPQFAKIGMGFGLASGNVVAGRFGSAELLEFSVIGEAVNLASRLQSVAEDGSVIACVTTAMALKFGLPGISFVEKHLDLKGLGLTPAHSLLIADAARHLGKRKREETGAFRIDVAALTKKPNPLPVTQLRLDQKDEEGGRDKTQGS